jgi:L-threonylcarbamoyladenylate synthase
MLNRWHLTLAARSLRSGGLVLHATEGVWGLACDPFDAEAVGRLLDLKGRSADKGLILIGASAECFAAELASIDEQARSVVQGAWPGPETWILPSERFPYWITGDHTGVAVRVPGHPQARALSRVFGGPLVSTSANPSGQPAPASAIRARGIFPQSAYPTSVDYILPGEVINPGSPSRIRSLAGEAIRG